MGMGMGQNEDTFRAERATGSKATTRNETRKSKWSVFMMLDDLAQI
jgi:hypothetical protein